MSWNRFVLCDVHLGVRERSRKGGYLFCRPVRQSPSFPQLRILSQWLDRKTILKSETFFPWPLNNGINHAGDHVAFFCDKGTILCFIFQKSNRQLVETSSSLSLQPGCSGSDSRRPHSHLSQQTSGHLRPHPYAT